MSEPLYDAVVLRLGEVFLKRDNRSYFVSHLLAQLKMLMGDLPWAIDSYQGRVVLRAKDPASAEDTLHEAIERAQRCFGVVTVSPAKLVAEPSMEALGATAAALAQATLPPGVTRFRVTPRRVDKRLPFTSLDMGRDVGAAVFLATGLTVDLHTPQFIVGVEAGKTSFVYTESLPGPGGLPAGTGARGLLLLSGGIDSPVAGYLALKRGCPLEALHFHSPPYTGPASRSKTEDLARRLAAWAGPITLHSIPITPFQLEVKAKAPQKLTVLLYRRFMMRLASRLAAERGAHALFSGESLGQVASQTVENLACIEAVAERPVLRPLVCFDKEEVVELARRIGTYDISIRPHEDSCSLFVPRHPEIHGRVKDLERAEQRLDLERLLEEAWAGLETVVLTAD